MRKRHWDLTGGLKNNRHHSSGGQPGHRHLANGQRICRQPDRRGFSGGDLAQPGTVGKTVYAHLLRTRVKKLGACQVLIIREKQNDPNSSTRFFATTRLKDSVEQVVDAAAKRWTVETLFADFKELMGSDQYQLHSAEAIRAFGRWGYACTNTWTVSAIASSDWKTTFFA